MTSMFRTTLIATTLSTGLIAASLSQAHFDSEQVSQSYRQSIFALMASNFGPLGDMAKGKRPFDAAAAQAYANDLAAIATLDLVRGFPEGSEKGTTRAKPGIWSNKDDFAQRWQAFGEATVKLQSAANSGDAGQVAAQVGAVGKTCKGCHDEYKAKDYLY